MERAAAALQRARSHRLACGGWRESVEGGRRRPHEYAARRQSRDGRDVQRLQAAPRVPLSQGGQQRRVSAWPLRGADRGLGREQRERRGHGRRRRDLRIPDSQPECGKGRRRVADLRHHVSRPDGDCGAQRHTGDLPDEHSWTHWRGARQLRGETGADHAAGGSWAGRVSQHRGDAGAVARPMTTYRGTAWPALRWLARALALAAGYFVVAKIGLRYATIGPSISPVW